MRVRKRLDAEKNQKNWIDSWLLGHFFWSPGAAEMTVDFQEFPVGDAQQADCGAGLDYIGDSSSDGIVPLLRRGFRNPRCFRVTTGCGFLEEDETLVV